jgi:hypothetical protein
MNLKLLILLVLVAAPLSVAAQQSKFVGYRHKGVTFGETLPNGVKDLGGGLLADENYGVTRFSKGGKFMLWLEKLTSRDKEGIPSWEVKDVLTFDKPKKNRQFLLSYSSGCLQNGKQNLDLIVLAQPSPETKSYKVIRVWKANTARGKFEKASVKGIVCTETES